MTPQELETTLNTYDETAALLRTLGQETAAANVEELREAYEEALDLGQQYAGEIHRLHTTLEEIERITTPIPATK
ncbi:hypothetical protein D7D52_35955 [Nocardia yunnanensis]|uniref:Uncharacterized protein n=1 Tax=Nocardia yunnanensis TaxID=2382165 RepID=A0A386ZP48_9NOCA|nr:hypothetical protein [Nocardia yunnanensis]AYF78335.1 hypothetical protein D7D52_35955 [Nocardia yunnanensis]